MSACRESANVWFYLRVYKKIPIRVLKSPALFQDSFLTPLNRVIGCKLLGHRHVGDISDANDGSEKFCFNCYQSIEEK